MDIKSTFLEKLINAENGYISGAAIARELGVSRNAVWKYADALREDGYEIDSVTAKGYRLTSCRNMSAGLISAWSRAEYLGKNAVVLHETESTNTVAKELASKGAPHGTVVTAESQTGGKGRLGRRFESPEGCGLYMSVIIRPDFGIEYAPYITSAAAVAAAEAVESLCGSEVQIKWVNDLYMNGKKICGILTEAVLGLETDSLDYAVIGIGINVRHIDFEGELKARATTVEDETGVTPDRNRLCAEVCGNLEKRLAEIPERGHLEEYRRRELLTGSMITANMGRENFVGRAIGIDDNANLIIELEDGTRRPLSSGEANKLRIKG